MSDKKKKMNPNEIKRCLFKSSYYLCTTFWQWKEINLLFYDEKDRFKQKNILEEAKKFLNELRNYFFISFCINIRDFFNALKALTNINDVKKFILSKTKVFKEIILLDDSKKMQFLSFPLHNYVYYEEPEYEKKFWDKQIPLLNSIIVKYSIDDLIEDVNKTFDQYLNTVFSIAKTEIKKENLTNKPFIDFLKKIILK